MSWHPDIPLKLIAAGMLAAAVSGLGCSRFHHVAPPPPAEVHAGLAPLTDAAGSARSLSLNPPGLATLPPRQAQNGEPPAWIASRNDRGPVVFAGYRSPVLESSVTLTRDRQATFNGRPYDSYRQRTSRESYVEAVR